MRDIASAVGVSPALLARHYGSKEGLVGTVDNTGSPVRRWSKLEVDPRVTESSDTSDRPAKPQDYAGLRAD